MGILIFYLALGLRLRIRVASALNIYWYKWLIFIPIVRVWVISCLAETNRTPFDFAEGESELVSGFNIEYGSLGFALIFMAEYARILLIGVIFSLIFYIKWHGQITYICKYQYRCNSMGLSSNNFTPIPL